MKSMTNNTPYIATSDDREIDPATLLMLRRTFMPDTLTPQDKPVLYAMAGIPGCGKSVFVDGALETGLFPKNAVLIDPDRIMQLIPEYLRDLADQGSEIAYQHWTMPARAFAYDLFETAGQKKFNIVQDMGSARQENYDRLKRFKDMGYYIDMFYVHCPVAEATRRLSDRARFTPKDMVSGRDQSLRGLLPQYERLADRFTVFDNSDPALRFQKSSLQKLGLV